jgi:uncharacterized protein YjbI with pentapeptide repeats
MVLLPEEFFSLAKDWIPKLISKLSEIRSVRETEVDILGDILRGDPVELARNYVEPDCQQFNPADSAEETDIAVVRQPAFDRLAQFCVNSPTRFSQMMVLADAGMGKTSLLVMYMLGYLYSFWPRHYRCVLFKIGRDTISRVEAVKDRRKTVLLLDALDEDPTSWGRTTARLHELLAATGQFFRVIITCRTQFFSGGEDPFERRGFVSTGGFSVPIVYLSSFLPTQVTEYLEKRFPDDETKRLQARAMVAKMQSLRARPMLLAHIEDLMDSQKHDWTQFSVYAALVSAWLMREERKAQERRDPDAPSADALLDVCHKIAWRLHGDNASDISESELTSWILNDPSLALVRGLDIRGRSLLNRTSKGSFRFSHSSIQEFLVIEAILSRRIAKPAALQTIRLTALMITFVLGAVSEGCVDKAVLQQVSLKRRDLAREDLGGLDLSGCDLSESRLDEVNFSRAILKDAILRDSMLRGVRASQAIFDFAVLEGAQLSEGNLNDASLKCINGTGMQFSSGQAQRANFGSAQLNRLYAPNASFRGAIFARAHLRNAQLSGADMEGADLSWADLSHADLSEANLTNADLRGAVVENANLRGTRQIGVKRNLGPI